MELEKHGIAHPEAGVVFFFRFFFPEVEERGTKPCVDFNCDS